MPTVFANSWSWFLWITDIHPIHWKLLSGMKFLCSFLLLAVLLSIWSSPLSLSRQKWCKCKEGRFGCLAFLKFVNTFYQAVVFLLAAGCCRISTIVSGPFCSPKLMDGVEFQSPQLHRTSSESCGWYVVPIEKHKRKKLLFSFKLLVTCILLTSMSPSLPIREPWDF